MSSSYYGPIESPLADALEAITGKRPPSWVNGIYSGRELGDRVLELQDWCGENANPHWATGLGVLEAAELLVEQAVENNNIHPQGAS